MFDLLAELAVIGVLGVIISEHFEGFGIEDWSESALPDLIVLFLFD